MFALAGTKWRNLRVKLTPTFTSGKMKMMFPIFDECANELTELLIKLEKENPIINIKDVLARLMTDVISSCAFGIKTNSIVNPGAEFRKYGMKVFAPTWEMAFRLQVTQLIPQLAKFLRVSIGPSSSKKTYTKYFSSNGSFMFVAAQFRTKRRQRILHELSERNSRV